MGHVEYKAANREKRRLRKAGYCDNANGVKLTFSIPKTCAPPLCCLPAAKEKARTAPDGGAHKGTRATRRSLLSNVNLLFFIDAPDKEDQRAQERDHGAADSHPEILRVSVNARMDFV